MLPIHSGSLCEPLRGARPVPQGCTSLPPDLAPQGQEELGLEYGAWGTCFAGGRAQAGPVFLTPEGALPLCAPGDLGSLWEGLGWECVRPCTGMEMGRCPCRGQSPSWNS